MSWNLESHILDHAAIVSNNLPDTFNLSDDKNVHFTFSVDKSQLIINHNCKNQKDIDRVMQSFFDDLVSYEYKFEESQGKTRPKRKMSLDLSQVLAAYHNTDSDSINSKNYEVEPHFHLLVPAKLKNKYGKSTKLGIGYLNLRRMIGEVATNHNLVFNFDENVDSEKDKILKQKATKFTWFTKKVDDNHFKSSIENGKVNKYIKDFISQYKKTENIQYYIKGMTDFQQRLIRQNIDFHHEGKNLRTEHFPLYLNQEQIKYLDIINTGDQELIKPLIKDRSNKLTRAYIEFNYGFNNPVIKELEKRGNIFKKLDLNLNDTKVEIEKKIDKKDKYKLSLNYHVSEDINSVLKICKNDKNFLELMNDIGYQNIKFKAKTINRKRSRVGFTFEKDNESYTVYFSNLNLTYQNFTDAYKQNSQKENIEDKINFYSYEAKINFYVPLKKKTYQEKIFYKIYNIVPDINLENYYIKKIEQGHIEFINKKKDIHITDEGQRIKSNKSNVNLVENVKLMLEVAKAKGWDLNNLHIRGTEQFINEVKRQVSIENEKEALNVNNKKEAADNLRELIKSESKQNEDCEI
ncbi:hypothetical protein GCM10012288_24430 [Malaciobacter pacificus]|uniref:Large polyvalent protein-associated domain-containing protein n=1 Tax=Malaciobacter pacificus TaxID=1080223 RepID=A0A5C2HFJ9_9BACT|nr:LPD7 domain-containing protein [Malaciobacter pacificus]QEP35192.1 hypothetical protein APAC_2120 [Malaciobacter pacificus]GGD49459.1 hypothetical protein GCM10012288_24430 [Malaciobacter pacificus]